jgi:hypothetical protein
MFDVALWIVAIAFIYLLYRWNTRHLSTSARTINVISAVSNLVEERRFSEDYRNKLFKGEPITPKHEKPRHLDGVKSLISDEDRKLFEAVDGYADWFNTIFEDGAWRLQESGKTDQTLFYWALGGDGYPTYGPIFEIFYNSTKVGSLEVSARTPLLDDDPEHQCDVMIELQYARTLPAEAVFDLLTATCQDLCWDEKQTFLQSIHRAMIASLWDASPSSPDQAVLMFAHHGGSFERWLRTKESRSQT